MPDNPAEIQPAPEKEVAEREIAYFYKDINLGDETAFPVYLARAKTWWMDGGVKLGLLLGRFKMHDTVNQACYITGITWEQYRDFKDLHPWFVPAIRVYKTLPAIRIKEVILEAAIGNKEKKILPNAKIALGAYRIFEEAETDADFAPLNAPIAVPPGGSSATLISESVRDAEGRILVRRRSAQITENYGDGSAD